MKRKFLLFAGGLAIIIITLAAVLLVRGAKEEAGNHGTAATPNAATYTPAPTATSAPTPTAVPSGKAYTNSDGVTCYNVVTQQDIDADPANAVLLTLMFPPCTDYGRQPVDVNILDYMNYPSMALFPKEGTPIVAPWDGVLDLTVVKGQHVLAGGGYVASVQNSQDPKLDIRFYIFENSQNRENGSFLEEKNLRPVKRGEIMGYVGVPLPGAFTDTGATLIVTYVDFHINAPKNPSDKDLWVGGALSYFAR